MPINTNHPLYIKNIETWNKNRDFFNGESDVKKQGEKYLPFIGSRTDNSTYEQYKKRAIFYGAITKTLSAITGIMFRKPPTLVEMPGKYNYDDFVKTYSLPVMLQNCASELFLIGRYGILVEMDDTLNSNNVPYFCGFDAEQIINWHYEGDQLQYVILKSADLRPDVNDIYKLNLVYKILELRLINGVYTQTHWESEDNQTYTVTEIVIPTSKGKKLNSIPFLFANANEVNSDIVKAPLTDLVNLNNHHYIKSADYSNGLHYVGLPTPFATGVSYDPEREWKLGSENIVMLSEPQATFGFAEVSGAGFSSLANCITAIEDNMAKIGARLFSAREQVISAETTRLNQASENSTLVSISNVIENLFYNAFKIAFEWLGIPYENFEFKLNKDFTNIQLQAGEISALLQAVMAGQMSRDTFLHNLKAGEIIPDNVTVDDEKEKIDAGL